MNENKVFYRREINYSPYGYGKVTTIFLDWIPGRRDYKPEYIKVGDKRIRIGIRQANRCPHGQVFDSENICVYSFDDQLAMWKAVYGIIVLKSEKRKMVGILKGLIKEMEQDLGENSPQERLF